MRKLQQNILSSKRVNVLNYFKYQGKNENIYPNEFSFLIERMSFKANGTKISPKNIKKKHNYSFYYNIRRLKCGLEAYYSG